MVAREWGTELEFKDNTKESGDGRTVLSGTVVADTGLLAFVKSTGAYIPRSELYCVQIQN